MIFKPTHTYTLYVCVCVTVWFVSVWVSSNITSVKHTHAHTHTDTHTRVQAHILFASHLPLNTTLSHVRTHTISTPGISDISCKHQAQWEKRLEELQMVACRHTHTHTQKEHFKLTMLTFYFFSEPFHLYAVRGQQCVPVERYWKSALRFQMLHLLASGHGGVKKQKTKKWALTWTTMTH